MAAPCLKDNAVSAREQQLLFTDPHDYCCQSSALPIWIQWKPLLCCFVVGCRVFLCTAYGLTWTSVCLSRLPVFWGQA
jgi:hypothetical protein